MVIYSALTYNVPHKHRKQDYSPWYTRFPTIVRSIMVTKLFSRMLLIVAWTPIIIIRVAVFIATLFGDLCVRILTLTFVLILAFGTSSRLIPSCRSFILCTAVLCSGLCSGALGFRTAVGTWCYVRSSRRSFLVWTRFLTIITLVFLVF